MAQAHEFTVAVTSDDAELDEVGARAQAWDVAKQHVGMDRYAQVSAMRLVDDGWRVVDGEWIRFWEFAIVAS